VIIYEKHIDVIISNIGALNKDLRKVVKIKGLRKVIITICLIILVVSGFSNLPESKYYNKDIKGLVNEKKAQVIEVGKGFKIDKDTIRIKRIINTQDKTYIRYAVIINEPGWSFSAGAIKVFDDKGRQYENHGGGFSGKIWGQDGIIEYERLGEDVKYITLKLEWYDRKNQLKISLGKEGEISEN